ncbi:helix-turn-helix domain-containing protein [Rhodococcus marinonascens]|uniref:helix-turn-helix domain-containing protein n=1 Tax=Rhodococcus marinonascens TaxID=38311 RepID=UPI000934B3DC|nr:helix-turn-helix domain-containing protein [Rhodococcus marinonascens]
MNPRSSFRGYPTVRGYAQRLLLGVIAILAMLLGVAGVGAATAAADTATVATTVTAGLSPQGVAAPRTGPTPTSPTYQLVRRYVDYLSCLWLNHVVREHDVRRLDHATLAVLRRRAVEQVQSGAHPEDVAEVLGLHRKTVYGWVAKFRAGGWEALEAKPVPGRPPIVCGGAQPRRRFAMAISIQLLGGQVRAPQFTTLPEP